MYIVQCQPVLYIHVEAAHRRAELLFYRVKIFDKHLITPKPQANIQLSM